MMIQTAASIGTRPFVYGWHHGWGGGWWLLFPVVWALVVLATVLIVRRLSQSRGQETSAQAPESGVAILDRRFAQGEIDEEEYRRRLAVLHGRDQ